MAQTDPTPKTQTLLSVTGVTGAQTAGHWFEVPRGNEHIPIVLSIPNGSATVAIEGRNTPSDAAATLQSGSSAGATLVIRVRQIRVHITAATAADVVVTVDEPVLDTGS